MRLGYIKNVPQGTGFSTYYKVFNVFVQVPINPESFLKIYYHVIM